MASASILSEIKVGDEIVIWSRISCDMRSCGVRSRRVAKVVRFTKTQLTIESNGNLPIRFTRSKGRAIGDNIHTGEQIATVLEKVPGKTFRHIERLMTVNDMVELKLKDNAKLRKARILTVISRVNIDDVTVGNLVEAAELLGLDVN